MKTDKVELIPIEEIHILNPRVRNQKIFQNIKENIKKVGLKRPITIKRSSSASDKSYDLVCGQGRLEAFIANGETHIPAIIVDADEEQALIMSLVENLARRQHSGLDLLKGIEVLYEKNYSNRDIANKTGLSFDYVSQIVRLIERGEERLLTAVESGRIPLNVAVNIAFSPGEEQKALQEAYENNQLRGKKLIQARKLIERRRVRGKSIKGDKRSSRNTSRSQNLFNSILKAEKLDTLPAPIADLLNENRKPYE